MAGWQFDIAFDHNALEAISVNEGDFLKQNGASTLFQGGSINNGAGKITELFHGAVSPKRCEWLRHAGAGELQGETGR